MAEKKVAKAEKKVAKAEKKPAGKKLIGKIGHYFTKIGVAVIEVEGAISVGDKISIEGPSTNFEQTIDSMQVEHKAVKSAKKGESIGMKVKEPVREKDLVYKVA